MPGSANEGVLLVSDGCADTVHRFGHLVGRVARHVLREGGAVYLASGPSGSASESFDFLEHFIGNRDRSLHTMSITVRRSR